METVWVSLDISAEEFLRLYEGTAKNVFCYSVDGRSVRFPAEILRPHVTYHGIHGLFRITFDDEGRFRGIEAIG